MFKRFDRSLFSPLQLFSLLFFCLIAGRGVAQSNYWPDSLKRELGRATGLAEKVRWAMSLAVYYYGLDNVQSDDFARQAIEAAEMSRDRMLMIWTYVKNGERYLENSGLARGTTRAMENFRRAEEIAKAENITEGLIDSYCALAMAFRVTGDNAQALTYSNQAITTAADRDIDSLQVLAYGSLGDSYLARNEKLLAFRNYLKVSDVAEQSKNDGLIGVASGKLCNFYDKIHDYDKAIDCELRVVGLDRKANHLFELTSDYNALAVLFTQKKQNDIALGLFEHSIALPDTIHFDLLKINSYFGIFQMYFKGKQYEKGKTYLNLHPEVMNFIDHAGLHFFIDEYYAIAFTKTRQFDSADFYFRRAEPEVESKGGMFVKAGFYDDQGEFYKSKGEVEKAIPYYIKEREIGQAGGDLTIMQDCALSLDSLYLRVGDFKSAYGYHTEYIRYSDSLRSLSREADLLKLEVDNDNRRRDRQAKEQELSREHRHNVQYMGFTVGLVVLFIALVMMGWLAVPVSVLRALGFLSFIFLFEFIILLADKTIQAWTHEEPWKVLLIKIGLAAILVPLHHWLEHKVIHFLSHRKRVAGGHKATVVKAGSA